MKDNYLENPNTDEDRQERAQQKKKSKGGKIVLTFIGFVIIAIAVFLGTIKLVQPDFKITQLIPERTTEVVETTQPTTVTATQTTTETTTEAVPDLDSAEYIPIEDFKFENGKKGNEMGNILSGGKVGTDASYIYHIVDGRGIYRFEPNGESYTRVYESSHALKSLNLKGDYLYFIDSEDSVFYRMKKGSGKAEKLQDSVKTAYVYANNIYFVTTDNSVKYMKTDKREPVELYSSADEVELVGISLNAVFFTVKDVSGTVQYLTVDLKKETGERYFRKSSENDKIVAPVLEDGFLYFFEQQEDMSYNLCRQKFGAQSAVTLIENVTSLNPVIVTKNRLFYGELDNESFRMMELNMNSKDIKTMLTVKKVSSDNTLICQHGGEYDFIIGNRNADGDKVYSASSYYTGSANIMRFKEGKWSYK